MFLFYTKTVIYKTSSIWNHLQYISIPLTLIVILVSSTAMLLFFYS